MPSPLIGITLHPPHDPDRANLDALTEMIAQGVERAGGSPMFVPLGLGEATLRALYGRLDGVLFSGGGDVAPSLYGAEPHPTMSGVDVERDRTEMALARWAAAEGKPLFGICRGMQMLNVALGGALYRDVSESTGAQRHSFSPEFPYGHLAHEIKVEEETRLAQILGQPVLKVNSMHHQALRAVALGLRVTAYAPDGIVEAVELPEHPFGLAVQWHPECLLNAPEMMRLFESFVEAAGEHTDYSEG
jgi:putative glutamine amidotransferase